MRSLALAGLLNLLIEVDSSRRSVNESLKRCFRNTFIHPGTWTISRFFRAPCSGSLKTKSLEWRSIDVQIIDYNEMMIRFLELLAYFRNFPCYLKTAIRSPGAMLGWLSLAFPGIRKTTGPIQWITCIGTILQLNAMSRLLTGSKTLQGRTENMVRRSGECGREAGGVHDPERSGVIPALSRPHAPVDNTS